MKPLLVGIAMAAAAAAQGLPEPPPLLRIVRGAAADARMAQRYAGTPAIAAIGLTSISGPAENWLLEAYETFTALERTERALRPTGDLRVAPFAPGLPAWSWLAIHRPWLGFRPLEAGRMLTRMRYLQALLFHVAPAAEEEFVALVKVRKASLDGLNLDRPEMAYQVVSGDRSITYAFLAPLASLEPLDESLSRLPAYARPAAKLVAAGHLTHEHLILRVEPALSMMPDRLAEDDPGFWKRR